MPDPSDGWRQLHTMFSEKAPPVPCVDCPHCGLPLLDGPNRVRYCPFGHYRTTD